MVAKTAATKKAKGIRAENRVAEHYRRYKIDETARRMPSSGAMSHFKGDIFKRFDYLYCDEVKSHETVRLRTFWNQTVAQSAMRIPVLHITANHRPIITVMRESDFDDIAGDDQRRYTVVDITEKKRWDFWSIARQCFDFSPVATVVYCALSDEALVMMTINTYMQLRKESLEV